MFKAFVGINDRIVRLGGIGNEDSLRHRLHVPISQLQSLSFSLRFGKITYDLQESREMPRWMEDSRKRPMGPEPGAILEAVNMILADTTYRSNIVKLSDELRRYDAQELVAQHVMELIEKRR